MKIITTGSPEHQELRDRAQSNNDNFILKQLEEAEAAGAKHLITLGTFHDALKHSSTKYNPQEYEIIINRGFYDFVNTKR